MPSDEDRSQRFMDDGIGLELQLAPGAVVTAAAGPPQVDTATGEPHTGAMVALIPESPEAWTLLDGEPADALHLTLAYLGDADLIPPAARATLIATLEDLATTTPAVEGAVFGASVWNTTGDEPSLNLAVSADGLARFRDLVWTYVGRAGVAGGPQALWSPPPQHEPWVAHVCVMYGDHEVGLEGFMGSVGAATQLEGPIRFDRLRLALGGDAYDFPLGGPPAPGASMSVTAHASNEEASMANAPTAAAPAAPPTDDSPCLDGQVLVEGECVDAPPDYEASAPPAMPGEHLRAIMHVQGTTTGLRDTGRRFTDTTYRDTPFAFHWSKASSAHGGQPLVVHVGNVVRVVAGGEGMPDYGFVTLDLASDDGAEYARRAVAGFERWVSIGLDETKPTVTVDWPEPDEDSEAGGMEMLFEEPDLVTIANGHVGELTGVSVPAQADAEVAPTDELIHLMLDPDEEEAVVAAYRPPAVPARPEPDPVAMADAVQALTAAAYTITIPDLPPAWWYGEPTDVDLSEGAFNLTDEGRIYGALAPLGVNHRAFANAGRRQEAPIDRVDHDRFMGAWALTASGQVPAGPVTMDCGHAARFRADGAVAPAHYENACTVVAKIAVGVNRARRVVWAAGALEPGVTIDQVSRMLACRLSGDWQAHSDRPGWTELIAALLVPSPGFAQGHGGASATYEGDVLVASSVPVRAVGPVGRPRLRIDTGTRTVERLNAASATERFRRAVADVRTGRTVRRPSRGCCD